MSVQRNVTDNQVPEVVSGLLGLCLLVSICLQYTTLSPAYGYLAVLLVYTALLGVFFRFTNLRISVKRRYVKLFLVLVVIAVLSTAENPTIGGGIRLAALLFFTSANFFVLPQVLPLNQLLYFTSRATIILIAIGLVPYLGGPTDLWFLDLSLWGVELYWSPVLVVMTSVFDNPNTLGFFALIGTIAAFGEWRSQRSPMSGVIFIVSIIGLGMTNNRSSWIALFAAFALFPIYQWGRREHLALALVGGLSVTGILMLAIFGFVPGADALTNLSLNGRRDLWIAGINALQTEPFLGHGLQYGGTHNSYIRIFAALGVGGGAVYLVLSLLAAVESARGMNSMAELTLTMVLVSFVYVQLFEGVGFIGISLHSIFISLMMGYHITGQANPGSIGADSTLNKTSMEDRIDSPDI